MKSQSVSTSKNVTLIIQKYTNNQKEQEQIYNLKLNKSQYLTTFSDVHNPLITKGFVAAQCSRRILKSVAFFPTHQGQIYKQHHETR